MISKLPNFGIQLALAAIFLGGISAAEIDRVDENGKVGYRDRATGQWIAVPTFGILSGVFSEGLVAVEVGGKWGYLDAAGRFAIEPQSTWHLARGFSEGLAAVIFPWNDAGTGGFGFIDREGKVVIRPAGYDMACDFSDGLAAVCVRMGEKRRYGFIDRAGAMVIEPKFDRGAAFNGGRAEVWIGDMRAVIDKTGKYLSPPVFPSAAEHTYVLSLRCRVDASTRGLNWSFVVRHKGEEPEFGSLAALETYLEKIPKGSDLEFAPSDARAGDEPLINSETDMRSFRDFCGRIGLKLKMVPGG